MPITDLELSESALRARRNVKWAVPADLLPAPVAEMDFSAPPAVQAAIDRIRDTQDYGYPKRHTSRPEFTLSEAFAARMGRLYGWEVDVETVQPVTDLVQAKFAVVHAFSQKGDGVIVQTPAYSPFFAAVEESQRRLLKMPMLWDGAQYRPDLASLERLAAGARILTICNPQNPTGRVFERGELLAMAEIALRHDLIILSDEIHSDLVFDGRVHIPLATLSPEIAARTITINSPTKSFNIPGLRAGVMAFGTRELRARFHDVIPRKLLGQISVFGMDAAVAAWSESETWLNDIRAALTARRDRLLARLAAEAPELSLPRPEATYLAWIDARALRLDGPAQAAFRDRGRLLLSGGEDFDPGQGAGFVRLNFAASQEILEQILDRVVQTVEGLRQRA